MPQLISLWRTWPAWWRRSIILSASLVLLVPLLLYTCSPKRLATRVDRPMTLAQAHKVGELLDFPFPPTAHDIYYASYSDWVAHETMIRFDASKQDCQAAMLNIIEWYEKRQNRHWTYPTVGLTATVRLPEPDHEVFSKVKWWEGVRMTQGFYAGKASSNTPEVWVDADLGRVYFYESD